MTARLDPAARRAALRRLSEDDLDVLVVGGGVVGAGAALDAVSRGLRVGLLERDDWGSGASGHSSTLVNGSWRDVSAPDIAELRGALRERSMLLGWLAPHLVRRVPVLYPLYRGPGERIVVGAEVLLYDTIARAVTVGEPLPAHRHLTRRAVRRVAPALPGERVSGGVQFYDAQVDDARLVTTIVRTAAAYGAYVAHRAEVTELLREGTRVTGVTVRDHQTGEDLTVAARVVVLAAGRWSTELLAAATPAPESDGRRHLYAVVPRPAIRSSTGIVVPGEGRGLVRIIPWGRHWLLGPVRVGSQAAAGPPVASAEDLDRLLSMVNPHLAIPLHRPQVQSCFAAVGPTTSPGLGPAHRPAPGLVLAGEARLSTYRLVAAGAVDGAAAEIGGLIAPSITERLPLVGADGYHARWNQRHLLARRAGLHVARVEHLLNRYGSAADDVLQLIGTRPELGQPLPGAADYLRAEVRYAVTHEGATTLEDILVRRTRIALDTPDGGLQAASTAAELAAEPLGWDTAEVERQVAVYQQWLRRERSGLIAL
ncbi:MAG TPA: FAD-dependent oxidoreductase [Propionibacteriaceae bacterium]